MAGARGPFTYERIAGGRSNLTYRGDRLRRPQLGAAAAAAGQGARLRPRHGPRASRRLGARPDAGSGRTDRRLLHRRGGQRRSLLRDGVRRGADPAVARGRRRLSTRPAAGRSASASSTRWSRSTPRCPTRSGSASSARRRTTSPASCVAGASSGRDRRPARSRSSNEVHDRLAERIPEQGPATLVHGDYRLDNMILDPRARSRPSSTGSSARSATRSPTSACCSSTGARRGTRCCRCSSRRRWRRASRPATRSATRYAERSGRDLAAIDFFVALGYWKLAIILEGVYSRYAKGQYGKPEAGFEEFGRNVGRLAEAADEAVEPPRLAACASVSADAVSRRRDAGSPSGVVSLGTG